MKVLFSKILKYLQIVLTFVGRCIFISPRGTIVELSTGSASKRRGVQQTGRSVSSPSCLTSLK